MCQTEFVSRALYQSIQTTKMNFEKLLGFKFSKTTTAIRFNLHQVYPSEASFVFVVSVIPSSRFLSDYFNVSLNLAAVPSV